MTHPLQLIKQSEEALESYWDGDMIDVDKANQLAALLEESVAALKQKEMKNFSELKVYHGEEDTCFETRHHVRLTFQYNDCFAFIVTSMGGSSAGSEIICGYDDLSIGLNARKSDPLNKTHAIFYDEDSEFDSSEVEAIRFVNPFDDKKEFIFDVQEAQAFMIRSEIIDVTLDPSDDDEEEDEDDE